jgi:hypothetical protein
MSMPARHLDSLRARVTRQQLPRPTRRHLEALRIVGPVLRRDASSLAERVVRESLRATMAPPVVEGLLEAIYAETREPMPTSGAALESFLGGPLAQALERTIGPSSTSFVLGEVRALLGDLLPTGDAERKSRISEVRLNRGARVDATRATGCLPPVVTSAPPVVMLVSRDAWLIGRVARELEGVAVVRAIHDAWSLVEALDTPSSRAPLVLFDCRRKELASLATSAQAASRGPLVLWGTDSAAELPVEDPAQAQIVTCSRVAGPADLSALCRVMLGIS